MKSTLRISASMMKIIKTDLARKHAFAAERVGFLFAGASDLGTEQPLLLARDYVPVKDEHYIRDFRVGAQIDANAIRSVRERILARQESAFHVHAHLGRGMPGLSRTDIAQLPPVVQSFATTGPALPHGLVLLSEDSVTSFVWMPGQTAAIIGGVVVVGMPLQQFLGKV